MYHSKLITMLQLGGGFGIASIRFVPRSSWRLTELFTTSSVVNSDTVLNSTKASNDNSIGKIEMHSDMPQAEESQSRSLDVIDNKAAHYAVNKIKTVLMKTLSKNSQAVEEIKSAKSIPDILNLTRSSGISTEDVVKIISTVSDFTQNKQMTPKNVAQNVLNKVESEQRKSITTELLYSVKTPEDIALFANLPISHCVQVLSLLRSKKKRDISILRQVAIQMSKQITELSTNESMNTLYSMASLNFPDENLLKKVSTDLLRTITLNEKPFVLDSILTSIGMLRYRNETLLKKLCQCVVNNCNALHSTHYLTLLQTLAVVGYKDPDVIQFIKDKIYPLQETDLCGTSEWVDLVWSLAVLDELQPKHLSSVLNKEFVDKLTDVNTNVVKFVKLLNINGVATVLSKNYEGPFLDKNSTIFGTSLSMSKEKEAAILVMAETLRNIFPSASYYNVNVNTQMGFLTDAECALDKNLEPVPVNPDVSSNSNYTRIAIIKYEYQDYCRGDGQLKGIVKLHERLLRATGYKLLTIPYELFKKKDKLIERTKYIHDNLKIVANESPS